MKVLAVIIGVIVVLIVLFIIKAIRDSKLRAEDQKLMVKSEEELIGEHLYIKREGADDIDVNLYRYKSSDPVPLVINLHGGAFVAGDADTLDTQSERISKAWGCTVVTVKGQILCYPFISDILEQFDELDDEQKKSFCLGACLIYFYRPKIIIQNTLLH